MDRLVFTSNATIKEHAVARQVLVNDLSNVSTVGFKSSYDVALQSVKVQGAGFDTRYQAQTISRDLIRMDAGPIMATGRPLDVALTEGSVLSVQSPDGGLAFTRRGDLKVNIQGQLENGSGHLILGENGPITIPPGLLINVNVDGSVYARNPAQEGAAADVLIDRLRLRDASGVSLARRQDGLFKIAEKPDGTDIEVSGLELRVIPQALESSNVSAIEAMTRLIDQSRSFETQIRIIKEMKGLDESGATMMKAA